MMLERLPRWSIGSMDQDMRSLAACKVLSKVGHWVESPLHQVVAGRINNFCIPNSLQGLWSMVRVVGSDSRSISTKFVALASLKTFRTLRKNNINIASSEALSVVPTLMLKFGRLNFWKTSLLVPGCTHPQDKAQYSQQIGIEFPGRSRKAGFGIKPVSRAVTNPHRSRKNHSLPCHKKGHVN